MSADFPRQADHPIDPSFLTRWSRRSFSGEPVADADLGSIFEAARWAPSSSNVQPWRFLFAKAGTPNFELFWQQLMPFNQPWARKAGVLIAVLSHTKMDRQGTIIESPNHAFDAGAAWQNLALQAHKLGYNTRAMFGFHHEQARAALHVPADYAMQAFIALGKPGPVEELPADYQSREVPTTRKPVAEIVFEGVFPS